MCSFICASLVSCLKETHTCTARPGNLLIVVFYSGHIIDVKAIVAGDETGLGPQIVSCELCYILLP